MAKKRVASIATIRQNISHLKKQIQRIKNMKLKAPRGDEGEVKVQRRGSQLIINGELYKAGDLEAMKGKSASWQLPVLEKLEQDLAREEYRLTARGKQPRELKALSELEATQARAGLKMITSSEQYEFDEWLNRGSDGIKKRLYYHEYGAQDINRGDIRGFLQFMNNIVGDIEEVADLPDKIEVVIA